MLIKKLTTEVSPPRLSIHWAEPWPMDDRHIKNAVKRKEDAKRFYWGREEYPGDDEICDPFFGYPITMEERRFRDAMGIVFMGERIRIFPEEYSVVSAKNMAEYIDPVEGSHYLIEEDIEAGRDQIPSVWESKEKKLLFEAALLDGCSIVQSLNVMEEKDVDFDVDLFPPVMGWYRAREEYARIFCSRDEGEITDSRKTR
jgi:hypothetical protein